MHPLLTRRTRKLLVSVAALLFMLVSAKFGTPKPAEVAPQPIASDLLPVTKVVDGDTIDVTVNGVKEAIRIIGLNTPETVDPRRPVECFGREASARAKELLTGTQVRLRADSTQDDRDKYGRLLRHVEMEDGTDFALKMIGEGYAYEYTYDVAYERQAEYRAAQKAASGAGLGLWSADTCDGKKALK